MLPKKGKTFPGSGTKVRQPDYATAIGQALKSELGGSHQSVKSIMTWTNASERTIKNWLAGTPGPSGEHLIQVLRHSDAVCLLVPRLARRDEALAAIQLADVRNRLIAAIAEIDRLGKT
jgi:hypothetical protein